MQWTGNIARTLGHVLLAIGIIALVLGIAGLVMGALFVKDAASHPRGDYSDLGDLVAGLVQGGLVLCVVGILGIVAGLVSMGIGRALRERLARSQAAQTQRLPGES